ncbi:hypothetical protein GJ496_003821 [Pomphorhynchus laevis]|nr:hypothetical protein GJ496_003821 [Pomphorhynchus laevis]
MYSHTDVYLNSNGNSRSHESDHHHSRKCILCEALLPSSTNLKHHLITAHHVVDSCLKNVLRLSQKYHQQCEQNGSTYYQHTRRQYSDDDSDKSQNSIIHNPSATHYRDYLHNQEQLQLNQRQCLAKSSERHYTDTIDACSKKPPDKRNARQAVLSSTTSLGKKSFDNGYRHDPEDKSASMLPGMECIYQLLESNEGNYAELPLEIGKSVQAITRWIKQAYPIPNSVDRTNNYRINDNNFNTHQLDEQQQMWSSRTAREGSVSVLSTSDSTTSIQSAESLLSACEPVAKNVQFIGISVDEAVSDTLVTLLDKVVNTLSNENFHEYVGYSSPAYTGNVRLLQEEEVRSSHQHNVINDCSDINWNGNGCLLQESCRFSSADNERANFHHQDVDCKSSSAESFPPPNDGVSGNADTSNQFHPKQIRTHILPEQQRSLMRYYVLDSNPSRHTLEDIAAKVGLRKRVVQVWFQNTRARERRTSGSRLQALSCSPAAAWFAVAAAAAAAASLKNQSDFHHPASAERSVDRRHHTTRFPDKYMSCDDDDDPNLDGIPSKSLKIENKLNKCSPCEEMCWKLFDKNRIVKNEPNENADALDCTIATSSSITKTDPHFLRSANAIVSPQKKSRSESNYNVANCNNRLNSDAHESHYIPGYLSSNSTTPIAMGIHHNGDNGRCNSGSNSVVRRFRTQMSPLQVRIMKAIFIDYKTPTMPECELLGREIGLQKRVVQVWFQNARAKEKKNPNHIRCEISRSDSSECSLCGIKYDGYTFIQRDHLFSTMHINSLRDIFLSNCKQESMKETAYDPIAARILWPLSPGFYQDLSINY